MKFANIKIGVRMTAGFTAVLLLMVALAMIGIKGMASIQARFDETVNLNMYKSHILNDMSDSVHVISRVMRTMVLLNDPQAVANEYKKIEQARQTYGKAWEALQKTSTSEKGQQVRDKIQTLLREGGAVNNKVIELALANKDEEATKLLLEVSGPAVARVQDALEEGVALQDASTKLDFEKAQQEYNDSHQMMLMLAGGAVALGALIAWLLTRSITVPLGEAVQVANRLADGDLTVKIEAPSKDETGQVLQAMQHMISKLSQVVTDVNSGAQALASASEQVSATAQALSQAA
ncbi:MAG: MCP four helix bundle domain-containing protein, partial [Pseudomonadota bacterium]